MGTRVLRGRPFTSADGRGSTRVALVNTAMARRLWPGRDALGRCFHIGADSTPCVQIVGIVEETRRDDLKAAESLQYFTPLDQEPEPPRTLYMFVRGRGDPTALLPAVRTALQQTDPRVPYPSIETMASILDPQIRPWRLGATLFGAFGLLALAVAAVGLYGVLAYDVAQRRHELGVRVALGARARDVLQLVVGRGLRLAAVGVALGLALAALAAPRIGELLFGVSPRDPATLAGVAGALLVVALAASVIPGWRAARVDPNTALRSD
jgi:predicted permease